MKEIFFVRHGATTWNLGPAKRYQGSVDTPLSPLGTEQASAVARFFADRPVSGIFSSPLQRAHGTAQRIQQVLGLPKVEVLPVLRELNFGAWEGKTWPEIDALYGGTRARWLADPESAVIPGAESVESLFSRAEEGLAAVLEQPGPMPVVVSHGAFIRAVLVHLLDLPRSHLNRIEQDPGAITAFRIFGSDVEMIFQNLDPTQMQGAD